MTREDKRIKETNSAAEHFIAGPLCEEKFTEEQQDFVMYCFAEGAQWADENPQSPWISVDDDLPCNHEELIDKEKNMTKRVLVIGKDGKANVTSNMMSMFFIENCWQWACEIYFKVTHWMPIPNLPEE